MDGKIDLTENRDFWSDDFTTLEVSHFTEDDVKSIVAGDIMFQPARDTRTPISFEETVEDAVTEHYFGKKKHDDESISALRLYESRLIKSTSVCCICGGIAEPWNEYTGYCAGCSRNEISKMPSGIPWRINRAVRFSGDGFVSVDDRDVLSAR